MTQIATRRSRVWIDPRLIIGIVLVVGSVIGVGYLVGTADRTTPVYAAEAALSPGDVVTADDLVLRDVRLDGTGDKYFTEGQLPDGGIVVTRFVAAGELLPLGAAGAASSSTVASVVVVLSSELPAAVTAGSTVDIWSAEQLDRGEFAAPAVLVPGATVTAVRDSESLVTGGSSISVEVQVPRARLARLLEAVANDDALSLVPDSEPIGDR